MENPVKTYDIHDNGRRPYRVTVYDPNDLFPPHCSINQMVKVYCHVPYDGIPSLVYDDNPSLTITAAKVFVGLDPKHMNFNNGLDKKFIGNTILVELASGDEQFTNQHIMQSHKYVWIGNRGVLKFTTEYPLIEYKSQVDDLNPIPYPWAKDVQGNYYLLSEGAMLLNQIDLEAKILKDGDPYNYYYNESCIVGQRNRPTILSEAFANIGDFFVGESSYNLSYHPYPGVRYDKITDYEGGIMTIEKVSTGMIIPLSRDEYIDLMMRAGKIAGFKPIVMETICEHGKTMFTVDKL